MRKCDWKWHEDGGLRPIDLQLQIKNSDNVLNNTRTEWIEGEWTQHLRNSSLALPGSSNKNKRRRSWAFRDSSPLKLGYAWIGLTSFRYNHFVSPVPCRCVGLIGSGCLTNDGIVFEADIIPFDQMTHPSPLNHSSRQVIFLLRLVQSGILFGSPHLHLSNLPKLRA